MEPIEPTKWTFWSLINKYWIEIPPIQRDYAQGRANDKANRIRRDFLNHLKEALSTNSPLNLDFVYGSTADDSRGTIFTPLDGQQRLTTLFLLHWYLATRDGCSVEARSILSRFTYKTRPSSTAFCNRLANQGIDRSRLGPDSKDFKELIVDSNWFHYSWRSDPTVNAMLTMLNDIHALFGNSDVTGWFQMLTRPLNQTPPITFDFLSLNKYPLTDELYVRMNARGKPLTEFENFKARFTDFLQNCDEWDEYWITENFSKKMDKAWTDLFWEYARPRDDSSSGGTEQALNFDLYLMNYIKFITEMLYAETVQENGKPSSFDSKKPLDFDLVEQVYSREKLANIHFLLKSLDFWKEVGDKYGSPSQWMRCLFCDSHEQDKVVLFHGDNSKGDLWTRCLTGDGFGLYEKILLFALTRRGVWLKSVNPNQFARFARVVRNLLQTVRYLHSTITQYELNIQAKDMPNLLSSLKDLIEAPDIDSFLIEENPRLRSMPGFNKFVWDWEMEKAQFVADHPNWKDQVERLEDHSNLRGILINLFDALQDAVEISPDAVVDIASDFEAIWKLENHPKVLIVRAFLAAGDYFIESKKTWYSLKYFGSPRRWNSILTYDRPDQKDRVGKALTELLKLYRGTEGSAEERLKKIIDSYLNREGTGEKDWRYYFIKYQEMVTWNTNWGDADAQNLFAWFTKDYEIRMLRKSSLQGFHINPYARAVAAGIFCENKHKYADPKVYASGLYSQDYAFQEFPDYFDFQPKPGVKLKCLQAGWKVTFAEGSPYRERWQAFGLEKESETVYWLCRNVNEDRIQKAIDFILSLE